MIDFKFASDEIATRYLLNASAERVFDWLIATNWGESGLVTGWFTPPVSELLARNEPLIDLAIATVCRDQEILRLLWRRNDPVLQIAVASNPYREGRFGSRKYSNLLSDDEFFDLCRSDKISLLKAWFANPKTHKDRLTKIVERKGFYSDLSDKNWLYILEITGMNPAISDNSDLRSHDYYESKSREDLEKAIWRLALSAPADTNYARILSEYINKLNGLALPERHIMGLSETGSSDWKAKQAEEISTYLSLVLGRWVDSPPAKSHRIQSTMHYDDFSCLRHAIAKAAARVHEATSILANASDPSTRQGYYERCIPTLKIIETGYKRDQAAFLASAVRNEMMYERDSLRPGIRSCFSALLYSRTEGDYEDIRFAREYWPSQALRLHNSDPARYPDPFYEDQSSSWEKDISTLTVTERLDLAIDELHALNRKHPEDHKGPAYAVVAEKFALVEREILTKVSALSEQIKRLDERASELAKTVEMARSEHEAKIENWNLDDIVAILQRRNALMDGDQNNYSAAKPRSLFARLFGFR